METRSPIRSHFVRTWLPNPGSILFTLFVFFGFLTAQNSGAWPLQQTGASLNSIPYQGRLADASGNNLTGTYPMVFSLYEAATYGPPLWTEQWPSVQVSDGLFNVMLGSIAAIPQSVFVNKSTLYLGIRIGSDAEMTPRVQLGTVPFAVQALTVPDSSISTAKLADSAVTTAKVEDGAITSRKLKPIIGANFGYENYCCLKLTSTYQKLGGTTTWFYVDVPSSVLINAKFDLVAWTDPGNWGPGQGGVGEILVDDKTVGSEAVFGAVKPYARGTVAAMALVDLSPGNHTISLRARQEYYDRAGGFEVFHKTGYNYIVFAR